MNKINISSDEKILIVAPHPDDECIGVGGILCTYTDQCDVLVLTDGSLGQKNQSTDLCREYRKKEFIEEMEFLGIRNYYMLQKPDGMLMNELHCMDDFDMKCYSKIFVTGQYDNHSDHAAAFWCVQNAIKFQELSGIEIYLYEVHNALSMPTHYLDITECMARKEHLIRIHKTQIQNFAYDKLARATAVYRALQNRMDNCMIEVFMLVNNEGDHETSRIVLEKKYQKFKMFYKVLTRWLLEYDKDLIGNFMIQNRIEKCAIYGYAELGKVLRRECEKRDVQVVYIVDQKAQKEPNDSIPFFRLGEEVKKEETIIVTAIYDYEAIKTNLQNYGYEKIYSLADIILGERNNELHFG